MYFRSSHVRLPVAMRLDVVENAQALLVGGRIVVVPQEPEAPAAILVDQAVDRLSDCVRHVVHLPLTLAACTHASQAFATRASLSWPPRHHSPPRPLRRLRPRRPSGNDREASGAPDAVDAEVAAVRGEHPTHSLPLGQPDQGLRPRCPWADHGTCASARASGVRRRTHRLAQAPEGLDASPMVTVVAMQEGDQGAGVDEAHDARRRPSRSRRSLSPVRTERSAGPPRASPIRCSRPS